MEIKTITTSHFEKNEYKDIIHSSFPIQSVLWGSGNYADKCIEHIAIVNRELVDLGISRIYSICCVVDNDECKWGKSYHGIEILSKDSVEWKNKIVIVGVKNHDEIDDYLSDKYCQAIYYTEDILFEKPVLYYLKSTGLFEHNNDYVRKLQFVNKYLGKSKRWKKKQVTTIAFYNTGLLNGGVERVISELFYLFDEKTNYRLIFICDTTFSEGEYPIPESVLRIRLKNDRSTSPCEWLMEIQRIVKDQDIDVIVNHDSFNPYHCQFGLMADNMGVRYIIEYHNCVKALGEDKNNCIRSYKYADCVVTLSESTANYWKDNGINSVYIPNPVKKSNYISVSRKENEILWIGRIAQYQKQIFSVIPVMKNVVEKRGDVILRIVGGEFELGVLKELKNRIAENNLEKNILLEGYQVDVGEYYLKASIMMMTSNFEGFPMVVVESKRAGLPLVLYELDDVELLKDGRGYIKVRQGDDKGMSEAILKLLEDKEYWRKLSRAAKESLQFFEEYPLVESWERVFKGL